jgi:hypothetical protein
MSSAAAGVSSYVCSSRPLYPAADIGAPLKTHILAATFELPRNAPAVMTLFHLNGELPHWFSRSGTCLAIDRSRVKKSIERSHFKDPRFADPRNDRVTVIKERQPGPNSPKRWGFLRRFDLQGLFRD